MINDDRNFQSSRGTNVSLVPLLSFRVLEFPIGEVMSALRRFSTIGHSAGVQFDMIIFRTVQ